MTHTGPLQASEQTRADGAKERWTHGPNERQRGDGPRAEGTRVKRIAIVAAGLLLAGLGVGSWYWLERSTPFPTTSHIPSASEPGSVRIVPQPVSATVDLVGTVAPATTAAVIAPFDGVIRERAVQLGDFVEEGDEIFVLDTSEITSRYREAQTAYLRAVMAAQEMDDWENGPEVQRARRSIEAAESTLASLERQVTELQVLLDRGIIARNEFDTLAQQRDAQRIATAGARTDYEALLTRASPEQRELVAVELENTQARVAELREQLEGASVLAPTSGIVVRPPDSSNSWTPNAIEPGSSLTRGSSIVSVADIANLVVIAYVDEIDVNQIQVGQSVGIASEAFGGGDLVGVVSGISSEARHQDSISGPAMFEVRASFAPTEDLRPLIRIGMSARISVTVYENEMALLVPPGSIISDAQGNAIQILVDGMPTQIPVMTGRAFPSGIEVLSGITPGTELLHVGAPR